ncbi:MAG: winged helix-turn-helix domain-containing protein [Rhizobiaceae bacterium]
MKEGPDISLLAALIGDPARSNMLMALMSGKALTAGELAREAGVTIQTASSHLGKLEGAGLLFKRHEGRHRYFSIADEDVAGVLESLTGLAAKRGHLRTRTGPKDPELRKARVCYNHLAGELGVQMYDSLIANHHIVLKDNTPLLTASGKKLVGEFGVDLEMLAKLRRPLCKSCLDWSARRSHLAGALGTALLNQFFELGWAARLDNSRVVAFSTDGEQKFRQMFI